MKTTLLLILIWLCTSLPVRAAAKDPMEARIDALLARMTLQEKLGQLQQLDGTAEGAPRPEFA